MFTRRRFAQMGAIFSANAMLRSPSLLASTLPKPAPQADLSIEIAPLTLDLSAKKRIRTVGYNGQVPGPVFRMQEGRPVMIDIHNGTTAAEIVHWHGLTIPSAADGAMEEGSPMIAPGASTRVAFTPAPSGFRWFHTHTFAGENLRVAQYSGQHGFLWIEPNDRSNAPPAHDQEVFLALHDWEAQEMGSDDGSTMPVYEVSTINGKVLGFGEPIRVKPNTRVLFHIVNSSPTEVHWLTLAGHEFHVFALDGNPVPTPHSVPMLCLAPAERVSAIVTMNAPGVWLLAEVRKHIHDAGMGAVVEYEGATGTPRWNQPSDLKWDYSAFAEPTRSEPSGPDRSNLPLEVPPVQIPVTFVPKFHGHGAEETWLINGKSYPQTASPLLRTGVRYRIVMKNESPDVHPIHLHRHVFSVKRLGAGPELHGLNKDVVLIPAKSSSEVEFTANNPGATLFHCHQQNHMDRGFMMVFRYA